MVSVIWVTGSVPGEGHAGRFSLPSIARAGVKPPYPVTRARRETSDSSSSAVSATLYWARTRGAGNVSGYRAMFCMTPLKPCPARPASLSPSTVPTP